MRKPFGHSPSLPARTHGRAGGGGRRDRPERPLSLIIFDYDGVLVNSLDEAIAAARGYCRSVSHRGTPSRETVETLEMMTYPQIARSVGLGHEHFERFSSYVFERFRAAGSSIPFFPGIEPLLRRLLQGGSKKSVSIVSGNSREVITEKLALHGLNAADACILGAFEAGDKSDKIRRACAHFGAEPRHACMVGDSASDVRHAKKAGVSSIAVTWGWQSREMIAKEGPDFIVDTVLELSELIDSDGSGQRPDIGRD